MLNMRRNIISLLLWFGVAAIFTIHVILQHRKDVHQVEEFSEKQITQVKTTILQRTELENIHQRKQKRGMGEGEEEKQGANEPGKPPSELGKTTIAPETTQSKEIDAHDTHDTGSIVRTEHSNDTREGERLVQKESHGGEHAIVKEQNQHDDGGSGMVDVQSLLDKAQEEIERLRTENKKLSEREQQLRKVARQLATKLKKGVSLPKVNAHLPWVFAITPTYARFTQKADLTRLVQTLQHVTNFHWIVVEDSPAPTQLVTNLLKESGLHYTHLHMATPQMMKKAPRWKKPHRGVAQRNHAMQWVRDHVDMGKTPGAVYFMDDDNTYHVNIFDQMRHTKHVSIWGVGLAGGARFAGPIVKEGKVVDFHVYWAPERSFPIDMCGFAVSLRVLLEEKPHVVFDAHAKLGHLEPTFLQSITTREQLEPLADNGTKILVWHTRTEVPKVSIRGEKMLLKTGRPTYPEIEV